MYYYEENGQCFAACQPLPLTAAEPEAFRYFEELVPPATISPARLVASVPANSELLAERPI